VSRLIVLLAYLFLSACGVAEQPDWAKTVVAYGIEAPTEKDRSDLIEILRRVARAQGHHVDSATDQELAEVYHLTINACAWKGKEDHETLACAMDFEERPGLIYLTFDKGSAPGLNTRFRDAVVDELTERFGALPKIPQMPNGALPLARELVLDGKNYTVSQDNLRRYEREAEQRGGE
jgi:hypothetical protein